jgi:signal transduction histidine kinase
VSATPETRDPPRTRTRAARIARPRDRSPRSSIAAAVEADRHFVSYAAHELRDSITVQRAVAEVALADPTADTAVLRAMGRRVVAGCERQEQLLEALLTLARSEQARLRWERVDLAASAAEVLRAHDPRGLSRVLSLEPARTTGDPGLVERLVANLVVNAIRHNRSGGRIDVRTHTVAEHAFFTVANTGPRIPSGELARLFEPFQRLSHYADDGAGVGLGLAIVRAIANAHGATISAHARSGGGLRIQVAFPALY